MRQDFPQSMGGRLSYMGWSELLSEMPLLPWERRRGLFRTTPFLWAGRRDLVAGIGTCRLGSSEADHLHLAWKEKSRKAEAGPGVGVYVGGGGRG